jgi:hypothetical protein
MRRLITNTLIFVFVLGAGLAFAPSATVQAQPAGGNTGGACAKNPLFPQWYDDLCTVENGSVKIKSPNDFKNGKTAQATGNALGTWVLVIVMNIVKTLLTVVGYVALAFVIWGGFKYMTQGDNAQGTAGARKTIQNAVIGIVIATMSIAIINFITSAIVA